MPELPEVETIVRTLAPQVSGLRMNGFRLLSPRTLQAGEDLLPLLEGALISGVRRRAKLLLLDLLDKSSLPLILAFHLKMTGRLLVREPGAEPHKHTKLVCELGSADAALPRARLFFDDVRTFGYCRLLRPESLPEWPFWAGIGLEPLEHAPEDLAEALGRRSGQIKNLLLNQSVIAGIGNIYADESLFRAGIRPDRKTRDLGREDLLLLARHIQDILGEAIAACGSSIRDYLDARGNAGAFQNQFNVYGRGGQACKRCGAVLASARLAGRGAVYCPRCQS
ncbi:MAG: bifunctional DNA-formamidopyrimidine glycosylase/DNA-(apurinic or apyrimidinic site) lyase [Deltaproteobacteria bacterium]|nr:bifunctional DNA-formamidopyrimidine glycosylase/DNA-(apurinic or apyrimidinic site) lyase [Deltaproteobacteria bacterium]